MRQILFHTPPKFEDRRPTRRRRGHRGRFSPEYVSLFCRWVTGRLLSRIASFRYYGRPSTDRLEYCPRRNLVIARVERKGIDRCFQLDEGETAEAYLAREDDASSVLWIPSREALLSAPDRTEFLRTLAWYKANEYWSHESLPRYIADHPDYIAEAEQVFAARRRFRKPMWELMRDLQVDIEKLTLSTQAEVVESRLIDT